MYELERREAELALEEKRQLEAKRALVQEATRKQDEPVDDSKLVEAMFDFLPDSSSEAPAPKDTSVFSDLPQLRADQQEVFHDLSFSVLRTNLQVSYLYISTL